MDELQILNGELDIANGPPALFDVTPGQAFLIELGFNSAFHPNDRFSHGVWILAQNNWGQAIREFLTDDGISRQNSGLQEGLLLPRLAVTIQIFLVGINGVDERSGPPPWSKPHVDSIQETF